MPHPDLPILILGTGLAGYNLAREIRKLDKTVPLVLCQPRRRPLLFQADAVQRAGRRQDR